jgi:hypothetical protein
MREPAQENALEGLPAKEQQSLLDLRAEANLSSHFIKAEANLLRLPLFALSTKGLRTLDGIECTGTLTRNNETHDFTFRTTRNTSTLYPGPLARATHLAFLSIATDGGFPVENPIDWTWRDLCRRMNIICSGRTVGLLKHAIESTKSLYIKSHYAVYSKSEGRLLRSQEEGLNLYDRFAFAGAELPGGEIADKNYLWLSGWYLDNLNAMFTAPLDYDLWQWLDRRSSIASRLYEFLLLNFYSGTPKLRINYEKLAQFLPVKAEKYRSDAKRQLDPAFQLLALTDVIDTATWSESKTGLAQLHIYRGRNLTPPRDRGQLSLDFMEEEFTGSIQVKELRYQKPPEWVIVVDFYEAWEGNAAHKPTKKELELARQIVEQHGFKKAKDLVGRVAKRLKKQWPDAKTFGAITKYLPDALRDYDRDQSRIDQEHQEQLRRQRERDERQRRENEQAQFEATWRPVWESLPKNERTEIHNSIVDGWPFLRSVPTLAERLCLAEVARRRGVEPPADFTLS